MQRALTEVLLQTTTYVDLAHQHLNSVQLVGEPPKIRFHDEKLFPIVMYKSDAVMLQRPHVLTLPPIMLRERLAEAMASCAMVRDYRIREAEFRAAADVRKARRPVLKPFKSAYWQVIYNELVLL